MYTYPCKVLNVVDGDTLDVELDLGFNIILKERVRLLGIDTPEVYGRYATPEGKIASDYTKGWIVTRESRTGGDFVYVSTKYDARDKYGRSLGVLTWMSPDGGIIESLNADLLLSNNAVVM